MSHFFDTLDGDVFSICCIFIQTSQKYFFLSFRYKNVKKKNHKKDIYVGQSKKNPQYSLIIIINYYYY